MKYLLVLLLSIGLLLWPSPLDVGSGLDSGRIIFSGGDRREQYLSVVSGPGVILDLARPDPVDMPPLEPSETALSGLHSGDKDAPVTGDSRLGFQPSTRGAFSFRVWVTHYSLEDFRRCLADTPECQPITASGWPVQVGHAASYPVRDAVGRIVSTYLGINGLPELPFGTVLAVEELGEVTVMDTGQGMPDGRPWLDMAVATRQEAVTGGAGWREITWAPETLRRRNEETCNRKRQRTKLKWLLRIGQRT